MNILHEIASKVSAKDLDTDCQDAVKVLENADENTSRADLFTAIGLLRVKKLYDREDLETSIVERTGDKVYVDVELVSAVFLEDVEIMHIFKVFVPFPFNDPEVAKYVNMPKVQDNLVQFIKLLEPVSFIMYVPPLVLFLTSDVPGRRHVMSEKLKAPMDILRTSVTIMNMYALIIDVIRHWNCTQIKLLNNEDIHSARRNRVFERYNRSISGIMDNKSKDTPKERTEQIIIVMEKVICDLIGFPQFFHKFLLSDFSEPSEKSHALEKAVKIQNEYLK